MREKQNNRKKFSLSGDCHKICVGSLVTSIHVVFPIIKVLNKLGSVNLITEDKSFLGLTHKFDDEFTLGNVNIRVVDTIGILTEEEIKSDDYTYTIFDIKEFIPTVPIDKYLFLTGRNEYRQQLVSATEKNKPIFSLFNPMYHTSEQKRIVTNSLYVNEKLVNLKQYPMYDKMIYDLITSKTDKIKIPSDLSNLIVDLIEEETLSKQVIRAYMLEGGFV